MTTITIRGNRVDAVTAEGAKASTEVEDLVRALKQSPFDMADYMPRAGDGNFTAQRDLAILIHSIQPRIWNLKWIRDDSPSRYGPGTGYRNVSIALPHVHVFALFHCAGPRRWQLTQFNECFFGTEPLRSLDQPLHYPALLNCSRFASQEDRPLSWICTEHLVRPKLRRGASFSEQIRANVDALLRCLFETGFNYSSEENELNSWYSESRRIDPRLETIAAWEEATKRDPLFVLDVPWIPTGLSAGEMRRRIFKIHGGDTRPVATADDLARILFHRRRRS